MTRERTRPVDAGTLLVRALRQSALSAGCAVQIDSVATRPWSSATFAGTQARVMLSGRHSGRLETWLGALPEIDLDVRGHLVADLAVADGATIADVRRAVLTVLTLEEC